MSESLTAPDFPWGVKVHDLNQDGRPDIVFSSSDDNSLTLLMGTGEGTFVGAVSYGVGERPRHVTCGDLDGDGRADDLATACAWSDEIAILLGEDDWTWAPPVFVQSGILPTAVCAGDVNGDGIDDLVVGQTEDVGCILSYGSGQFSEMVFSESRLYERDIVLADFNGDCLLDVMVPSGPYKCASVLLGDGDGTFSSTEIYAVGEYPRALALCDLNHDGIKDVCVAGHEGNDLTILLANRDSSACPDPGQPTGCNWDLCVGPVSIRSGRFWVEFATAAANEARLRLIDVSGRVVWTYMDERIQAGKHRREYSIKATDEFRLASGVYYLRLDTSSGTTTKRLALIR